MMTGSGESAIAMDRSDEGFTVVVAVLLLLDESGSLTSGEDTLAVLLIDVTPGTVIVTVMAGAVMPDARLGLVHVT
jgi:hypothetical protein